MLTFKFLDFAMRFRNVPTFDVLIRKLILCSVKKLL